MLAIEVGHGQDPDVRGPKEEVPKSSANLVKGYHPACRWPGKVVVRA